MHPLLAFPSRKRTESGKIAYIPCRQATDNDINMYFGKEGIGFKKDSNVEINPILLPCGKCIGCRLDKSREWALRCMMELKENNGIASFVTLTYNESCVPISYFPDPNTGEALPVLTLKLDDLQRFWKRLRKSLPENKKIRYFACGEYGANGFRPHYHAIIFGYWPDDLVTYQVNQSTTYYTSAALNRIWHNGNVLVAPVNFDTCAYVARYTAKKSMTLGDEFFVEHNMEVPFLAMSRRPGIGWSYMASHPNFFDCDKIYVSGDDPCDGRVPRSFLARLEDADPQLFEQIRERRKLKGSTYEKALALSHNVPYSKLLADAEANLLAKSRAIKRNKV